MVGDELEAAHQFVSPAKYFAAWRSIDFSVSIFAFSAPSWASPASSRATFSPASPASRSAVCSPGGRVPSAAVVEPVPNV